MLDRIFYPYLSFLSGAAWNIQQNLDGLGVTSVDPVPIAAGGALSATLWSPIGSVGLWLLTFVGASLGLALCIALVGYVIGRMKGAKIALFLMILPAMLGALNWWPNISFVPDSYHIDGAGVLGSGLSMVPMVLMGVLAGWCTMMLLIDNFHIKGKYRIDDRFWAGYDHFWYAAGLLAGIFFVADSQISVHARDYQDNAQTSKEASAYLLRQVMAYDQWCRSTTRADSLSCHWASDVQLMLLRDATDGASLFVTFGPRTTSEMYAGIGMRAKPADVTEIRREIAAYNHMQCPVKDIAPGFRQDSRPSYRCQETPAAFHTALTEPLDGQKDNGTYDITSVANEAVVPTLVRLRASMEQSAIKVKDDLRARHYRWLYYLFFSIAAGAKIANATVKLALIHKRDVSDMRRSVYALRRLQVLLRFWFFMVLGKLARALTTKTVKRQSERDQ